MDNPHIPRQRFGRGTIRRRIPILIPAAVPSQAIERARPWDYSGPPLHESLTEVNPQSESPLYNGRIPPEIRDQIFKYAMVEYTKTDEESQYPKETDYTRPGYTGKRVVPISLLLTCRKVYMETYHLPVQNREHVFWHENTRAPPHQERYSGYEDQTREQTYFGTFAPWQLELVKKVHLFTQQYWLEDEEFFLRLSEEQCMQGIEIIKITIRRGDWWHNERNQALAIKPLENAWGKAFSNLASLKELEFEFETSEDKAAELGRIVETAKLWKFPLKDGKVLSTEGREAKMWKWRGPLNFWSVQCPYCHRYRCSTANQPANERCEKKKELKAQGLGPECTVMSLRWRVVDADITTQD